MLQHLDKGKNGAIDLNLNISENPFCEDSKILHEINRFLINIVHY